MVIITEEQQLNIERNHGHYLDSLQPAYRPGAIRAIAAAEALADAVNEINFDSQSFARAIAWQHRTLQQSVMRALVAVVEQFAEHAKAGNYDLRNEGACQLAAEVVKLPCYLPFV